MLRSRKLNAPGPKWVIADMWACGCDVKSLRAQFDMNNGGCIAASGEEASMTVNWPWITLLQVRLTSM